MSECTNGETRDLLPELVNGRLGAELQLAVEAHVAECAECAAELTLLRGLRPALMRGPVLDTKRIAAAALVAVGATAYVVVTRERSAPEAVAVHAPDSSTGGESTRASIAAPVPAPVAPAPRAAPAPAPPRQVAVAPSAAPTASAIGGVLDNLSDLSDDDVRTLTASLDGMSAVPDIEPAPEIDPLGASLDAQSSGGT
ncbi:MAG TPA: zf-HC2 domain-containing protein [Gemmatimonadaceae bacterium]